MRYRAWTSTFLDAARIWRDTIPYDLFRGCSISAYSPGSAIRRKIADRVPFTSDRFASTFYTCVIYISPKLSWHDGAHRSARHDYLMDCVRIRLNTQWLNSYELWANVCVSAHVVKASIKETKRFYKPCDVSHCCKSPTFLSRACIPILSLIYHRMPWRNITIGFCWMIQISFNTHWCSATVEL